MATLEKTIDLLYALPENAEKPIDRRMVSGQYKDWRKKTKKSE